LKQAVVGHLDGPGVGLEAVERGDRAKGFSDLVTTMSVVTDGKDWRRVDRQHQLDHAIC
jgi:hypothetical protein